MFFGATASEGMGGLGDNKARKKAKPVRAPKPNKSPFLPKAAKSSGVKQLVAPPLPGFTPAVLTADRVAQIESAPSYSGHSTRDGVLATINNVAGSIFSSRARGGGNNPSSIEQYTPPHTETSASASASDGRDVGAAAGEKVGGIFDGAIKFVKDYPLPVLAVGALVLLKQSKPYSRR